MTTPIRIIAVDGRDEADTLTDLQRETLPGDILVDPSVGHWWIAYQGYDPVAFLGMVPSYLYLNWGYITRVGVTPAARGCGLQYRLTRTAERKGRKLGLEGIESNTYENPPSTNNFIRLGYRTCEPSIRYFADGTTYWIKEL